MGEDRRGSMSCVGEELEPGRSKMQDTTQEEKRFEQSNTVRGRFCSPCRDNYCDESDYALCGSVCPHAVSLLGLTLIVVGPWALAQCTAILPVVPQASVSVIIISVLITIVGLLMVAVAIGSVLAVKYKRASKQYHSTLLMPGILIIILAVISVTLGVAAGALIPTLSETIRTSVNSSSLSFYDSPGVRDAWNVAQDTLQCCGLMDFSDYEQVFGNLSVPVSCCNMTSLLVNETTCPLDIDVAVNNTIYSVGCAPQLESLFRYILSVVAGVSITVGLLQIIGEMFSISCIGWKVYESRIFTDAYRYFHMAAGLILVFGLGFIPVAIWALVQNSLFYYSTTAPANAPVIALSVLLIIVGVVMAATSICQLVAGMKMDDDNLLCHCFIGSFVVCMSIPLILLVMAVGIAAAVLSGTTMEFGNTLSNYTNDQSVQETWNALQENLECCGAVNYTDYRAIFSNFSVPVSCCNSTHPLASNCSEIVVNTQQTINQTSLIYSKGCVSHLESSFMNIFRVVAVVSITIGTLQLIATIVWLTMYIWFGLGLCSELD